RHLLPVEVCHLLEEVDVVQEDRAIGSHGERVAVTDGGRARAGGGRGGGRAGGGPGGVGGPGHVTISLGCRFRRGDVPTSIGGPRRLATTPGPERRSCHDPLP